MMALLCLVIIQLWNQPSVRMIGFGRNSTGFIPDPITDLNLNPSSLKDFGSGYVNTFNSLQIYALIQKIDEIDSVIYLDDERKDIYLRRAEPLALFIFYPKLGIGFRTGAFMRYDMRNHSDIEQWLYGQNGFIGALNLGKYIKIGGEYNWSWNNQPDEFELAVWDSLGNERDLPVAHGEFSNEVGIGAIISNNKMWHLSLSAKKNWEANYYTGHFLWPDEWQSEWNERRADMRFFTRFTTDFHNLKMVFKYDYYKNINIYRKYYAPEESTVFKFSSLQPGITIIYFPYENILTLMGFIHSYYEYEEYYVRSLIVPVGFEKKLNAYLQFRFGATFLYCHKNTYPGIVLSPSIEDSWIKNEINVGMDFYLYDKMCVCLATQDLLNYQKYFFGLNLVL